MRNWNHKNSETVDLDQTLKMCKPRCVSDDEVSCYNPKLKVDRGIWKEAVAYGRSSRRMAVWAFLSACCVVLIVSVYHYQDAKYLVVPPSPSLWLRRVKTPKYPTPTSVLVPPLAIQNLPTSLAWKKGRKNPGTTNNKVLPADAGYYFNPSILELADGKHIFAVRMGWLYHSGCEKFMAASVASPSSELMVESAFHCLKHHKERFVDQTLLGEFDPLSQTMVVHDQGQAPSSMQPSLQDFDLTSWDAGASWHDTRLLHPFNYRPVPGVDKILLTSQNIEIIGHSDWNALDLDSNLCLHLTYITALDPSRILEPVSLNRHKMSRWLYYDAELERQEWGRRKRGESQWQLSPFDVARLKCHQRPPGLPALPFDPHAVSMYSASEIDQRRLSDSWYFIKDKNWSPFAYKGSILWSYKLEPHHVVCENDVDLNQEGSQDVDCVLCVTKYNSTSSHIFESLYHGLHQEGYDDVVAHLNGAPAFFVPGKNVYLGLMHIIKVNRTTDELGWEKRTKTYEHYFYTLEATPPFRVNAVATLRVALERSRGWSHWFDIDDLVTVEFVMNLQFHPDRKGREIVISYGDGDRFSRIATLSMDDVWASFDL